MNDLQARFAEVEKRVTNLIADNASLRTRVAELERELERARTEAGDARDFQTKQARIREKIEQVILSLDAIGQDRKQAGSESR